MCASGASKTYLSDLFGAHDKLAPQKKYFQKRERFLTINKIQPILYCFEAQENIQSTITLHDKNIILEFLITKQYRTNLTIKLLGSKLSRETNI